MSCDEFACQLLGRERTLLRATAIAYEIKRELRTVGITLRCSVGLAPNRLLAKIAGDMQKPDGLMIFERRYLPQALYSLELEDIPGIGKRMEQRILAEGITTMRQLCALTRERMHTIWGGVLGDRLWLWLRGEDFLEPPARPLQTLSRQHILPPDCRTPDRPAPWRSNYYTPRLARCAAMISGPAASPCRLAFMIMSHSPAMYASSHATIHTPAGALNCRMAARSRPHALRPICSSYPS